MKIIIAGGGVAAHEAAVAARNTAPDAEIIICSGENIRPYRRPALSGLLKNGNPPDEKTFFIKPESFYADNRITLRLNSPVEAIGEKFVVLSDGSRESFDRLIIATGGKACVPQLPAAPGVLIFTLREYMDLLKLQAFLPDCRQVAVIGGGVLALEIADSLLARNIQVTVLERANSLFPGRLAPEDAAELLNRLNRHENLSVRCGENAAGIGRAGVITASGEVVPADAVIFAAGSAPRNILAVEAGIAVNRGILVDEKMRSSAADIFAAGDVAEYAGNTFGLYLDAMNTGKIAGINAAGGNAQFTPAARTPVRLMALGEKLVMP